MSNTKKFVLVTCCLFSLVGILWAADVKISALTPKGTPVSADTTIIVDSVGGANKKITLGTIPLPVLPEASDTTMWPLFSGLNTGDSAAKTHAGWTFNAATGMLTGTGFTGPVTQAIGTIASSATPHPSSNGDAGGTKVNHFTITAQAEALVLHAPAGTWADGDKLLVRILDNGSAWGITYESNKYVSRISGTALPSTTVISKYLYMGFIYNSTADRMEMVALVQE